jgi:hypothetical protein
VTYYTLYDEQGRNHSVPKQAFRSITYAPAEWMASRYELWTGVVLWSSRGFRGWYDEHKLQGGLRTITFENPTRTDKCTE